MTTRAHKDSDTASSEEHYRLPRSVRPRRYRLRLAPDLDANGFSGEEEVELEVLEETDRIVLNAVDLELERARLVPGWSVDEVGDEELGLSLEWDPPREQVAFVASSVLAPGHYRLRVGFSGRFGERLHGFYRSNFVDQHGAQRAIATTQFEETHARRAFPCFDEPEAKAIFSITLDAPPGTIALSNAAERASEPLASGGRRVHFADTIPMSTYLVAFVVGPLELSAPIEVDGVAVRVAHVPGRAHLTGPALEAAAHALRYYTAYFDAPYPGDKLDLVAIPDFAAGAMENLGCVTFREAILLADPETASRPELERLAEVVEHELAHMWFGDLVTMRWWNGIWLNEAFATFMALRCLDDYRPEWEVFVGFARSKASALAIDGLHRTRPVEYPVHAPEEAAAMFDVLTYEKGASVLWMLEQYLGEDRFRDGVRRYLRAHAFANTETCDLWEAIEAEADDVEVRSVMDSWIFQGGYPLVRATSALDDQGEEVVELRQSPFAYLPVDAAFLDGKGRSAIGSDWLVPVLAAPLRERAGGAEVRLKVLLAEEPAHLPPVAGPVVLNAGGSGFFRLSYDRTLLSGLLAELETLQPVERYNLLSDLWATVVAGIDPLADLFSVFDRLADESDPHVWSVAIGALGLLEALCPDLQRPALHRYVRALLGPQLDRLGWQPADDEGEQAPLLRASLIAALGTFAEDEAVFERAHELFRAELAGHAPMPPDLASSVLSVVAHWASREDFEAILARYRSPRDPMEEMRYLSSLGHLSDVDLASEVLELTLSEIRSQNAPYLLASMLANRHIGPRSWSFVSDHFEEMLERFPENSIARMLEGIVVLAQCEPDGTPRYAPAIRSFYETRVPSAHRGLVGRSLERLEVNVRLARRLPEELPVLLRRS
jgi:puromycin-sensitive aminopeptidase